MTPKQLQSIFKQVRPTERRSFKLAIIGMILLETIALILAVTASSEWLLLSFGILLLSDYYLRKKFIINPTLVLKVRNWWLILALLFVSGIYCLTHGATIAQFFTNGTPDDIELLMGRYMFSGIAFLLIPVFYRESYLNVESVLRSRKVKGIKPGDLFR